MQLEQYYYQYSSSEAAAESRIPREYSGQGFPFTPSLRHSVTPSRVIEIIPSINHSDPREIRRRIKLVEPYVSWVNIDVSDGVFSSKKIFNEPAALYDLQTSANIELHLMIDKPEEHLDAWLKTPAKRFLVHIESTQVFDEIADRCIRAGREVGFALHTPTSPEVYVPYAERIPYVLVLGVIPGPSGQEMLPGTIEKISTLRKAHPSAIIEVDGGVSLAKGTAKMAVDAGANALCVGNDIFSSNDVAGTIEQFRNL